MFAGTYFWGLLKKIAKNAKIRTRKNFVTHGSPQGLSIAQPFSAEKKN